MDKIAVQETLAEPYKFLSEIYDLVMNHVNYKQWARYIQTLLSANAKMATRIADLSCGTGSLLSNLSFTKKHFLGCDLSLDMLVQAAAKKYLAQTDLLCMDFKNIPLKTSCLDVAVALYDSVNYLMDEQQADMFFMEATRILKPGGILIFDAVTPYICKTAFRDYHESQYYDENYSYERRSWYDATEQIQYNKFRINRNGVQVEELHQQKIRSISQWKKRALNNSLKIEAVYSNFTFLPVHRKSERAHFVCRKVT